MILFNVVILDVVPGLAAIHIYPRRTHGSMLSPHVVQTIRSAIVVYQRNIVEIIVGTSTLVEYVRNTQINE